MKGWVVDVLTLLALLFAGFTIVVLLSLLNLAYGKSAPQVQEWTLNYCFDPAWHDYDCRELSRPLDYKICLAVRDALNRSAPSGRAFCRPMIYRSRNTDAQ